jgi:dTDP-4-dehydrorhamnose reductase
MPRILIFGNGFIGSKLAKELGAEIADRVINSFSDAQSEFDKYSPDIIINCIGYTGKSNVDDCEKDIDKTLSANSFVPIILAELALRNRVKLIHISSGCIFHYDYDKSKPITEDKVPDFFDLFYSRSKIYSERALEVLSRENDILILRIRIPLDDRSSRKNILDKLLGFGKVIKTPNTVTYLPDFISAIKHLIKVNAKGIYNTVNRGGLEYSELMEVYKKYVPDFKYEVINDLSLVRTNLLMSTDKLEATGFRVRKIKDVLDECVCNYIKNRGKNE